MTNQSIELQRNELTMGFDGILCALEQCQRQDKTVQDSTRQSKPHENTEGPGLLQEAASTAGRLVQKTLLLCHPRGGGNHTPIPRIPNRFHRSTKGWGGTNYWTGVSTYYYI